MIVFPYIKRNGTDLKRLLEEARENNGIILLYRSSGVNIFINNGACSLSF